MSIMRRRSCLGLLLAAAVAAPRVPAAEVAGVDFVDRLRLAGADLLLNGVGVRAVAWFKGYAAALYLTGRARSARLGARCQHPPAARHCADVGA